VSDSLCRINWFKSGHSAGGLSSTATASDLWRRLSYCGLAWAVVMLSCLACGVRSVEDWGTPLPGTLTPGATAVSATLSPTPTRSPTATEMPTLVRSVPSATLPPATPSATATAKPTTVPPPPSATTGQPEVFADLVEENLDVFVRLPDGTVLNLTNHPSADAYPSLSPDGRRVLFVSNRDGPSHVFLVGADGSGLVRLTDSGYGDTQPQWAPDGQRIAYQTLLADHNWEIYCMRPDGSQKVNLTNNAAIDVSPAWSPDGALIAFETDRDGDYEIYVMAADGSNPTNVTQNAASHDISPIWSDDERILFRSDRDGARFEYRQYAINPDGSGLQLIDE
jgi:hypothetical protein